MLSARKERQLGHVIRSWNTDPLYLVSFDDEGSRLEHSARRVGRPRNNWIEKTSERTYANLTWEVFDRTDEEHRVRLFCAAFERMFYTQLRRGIFEVLGRANTPYICIYRICIYL